MMNFEDTIAAISTAPGTGALAVVRLSGPKSFSIAKEIFLPGRDQSVSQKIIPDESRTQFELKSNFATHGYVVDPATNERVDEVVLTAFKAPHTYTGEDLVEISCHGGAVLTAEILSLLLTRGARLARRGEFTQRAFMCGRIDLTQAEAVLDIIQAKTTRQGRRALSALSGLLGERIKESRSELMELLTRVVAGIDFPEEIGDAPEPEVEGVVRRNHDRLLDLASTARSGRFLRDGVRVAIVGRPNAGKSSLLNQLLKFERAIVTDIPGTTRDSLEEILDINGIPVVLVDTAGVRHTEDQVELIGIERTKKAINDCDLILFVVDLKEGWSEPENVIASLIDGKDFLLVGNKLDVATKGVADQTGNANNADTSIGTVLLSAKTGERIEDLTASIEAYVFADCTSREGPSLNARQGELCLKAASALKLVENTLAGGYPQDCLATDLKTAVDALSELSGEAVSEEVITQVFATFCIGK